MAVIETKSEEGSDGDWSEHGQVLLGVGQQKGITQKVRQRQKEDTRLVTDNEKEVSDFHSNSLGKSTGDVAVKVKNHVGDSVVLGENNRMIRICPRWE
jgi:phage/plasmid-associated DNA primase